MLNNSALPLGRNTGMNFYSQIDSNNSTLAKEYQQNQLNATLGANKFFNKRVPIQCQNGSLSLSFNIKGTKQAIHNNKETEA